MEGLTEVHEFNTYLALVDMKRNVNTELYKNIMGNYKITKKQTQERINEIKKAKELLNAIEYYSIDYVEKLLNNGYEVPFYKDVIYKLAIKREEFEKLLLLCNDNTSYLLSIMINDIPKFGTVHFFEKLLNHIINKTEGYNKMISVKDFLWINNNLINFKKIANGCVYHKNFQLLLHLITNYNDYINIDKNNINLFMLFT